MGFSVRDSGYGIRDTGCVIRDTRCEIRDVGCGILDMGYVIRDLWSGTGIHDCWDCPERAKDSSRGQRPRKKEYYKLITLKGLNNK